MPDADHEGGDEAEPEVLHEDEGKRGQRLAAEEGGGNEGIAGEATERLDLVLDHGGDLGPLHALELGRGEPQDPVDEIEADPPQQPLAEPALVGVDVELEEAVDDDEQQEDGAQCVERLHARQRKALEYLETADARQPEAEVEKPLRRARLLEALALDRPVDDLLRQVEGHEIGDHRDGDDQQNPELLLARVGPDVPGESIFHEVTASKRYGGAAATGETLSPPSGQLNAALTRLPPSVYIR